jgi:hypothetical protein
MLEVADRMTLKVYGAGMGTRSPRFARKSRKVAEARMSLVEERYGEVCRYGARTVVPIRESGLENAEVGKKNPVVLATRNSRKSRTKAKFYAFAI